MCNPRYREVELLRVLLWPFVRDLRSGVGTSAPSRRAADSPIAMACLRLVTFFPERPRRNSPRFISCIACPTLALAFLLYLRFALAWRVPLAEGLEPDAPLARVLLDLVELGERRFGLLCAAIRGGVFVRLSFWEPEREPPESGLASSRARKVARLRGKARLAGEARLLLVLDRTGTRSLAARRDETVRDAAPLRSSSCLGLLLLVLVCITVGPACCVPSAASCAQRLT